MQSRITRKRIRLFDKWLTCIFALLMEDKFSEKTGSGSADKFLDRSRP